MSELLFLQNRSVSDWRELASSTHKKQYKNLIEHSRSYVGNIPPVMHPDDSITYIGAAIANLSLSYLLSEEIVFFDTLKEWISVAIGYEHWGKHRKPDHDLDAAWLMMGLSLAYNWLKSEFSEEDYKRLKNKLFIQASRMFEYVTAIKGDWTYHFWQNHNWICFTALAIAGYALEEDFSDTKAWIKVSLENLKKVFSFLPDDGSDYEGPVYWRYGVPWLLIADALFMHRADITLNSMSGFLSNTFFFRLYISGPNLIDTNTMGDCHDRRSSHSKMILYRLASLYNNGYAQWLADYFDATGEWEREKKEGLVKPGLGPEALWEFLWFDPNVKAKDINELPLYRVFPDLGLVSVRTGWDNNSTVLVYKCSQPSGKKAWHYGHILEKKYGWHVISAGHAHPDENSFILAKGRDFLVVDEGYNRACYSKYHSTVIIDGKGQYKEGGHNVFEKLGPDWGGRLNRAFGLDKIFYMQGDAAGAYDASLLLTSFSREILFLEGDVVVINDCLSSEEEHTYSWLLQTDYPAQKSGKSVFTVNAVNAEMKISVPGNNDMDYKIIKHEISANPTSAKPDWLLKREQYSLCLEKKAKNTTFLTVLATSPVSVFTVSTSRGKCLSVESKEKSWLLGFSQYSSGILVDKRLNTDAISFVALYDDTGLVKLLASESSFLWLEDSPVFICDSIVSTAMRISEKHMTCVVLSSSPAWLSLYTPWKPKTVTCNSKVVEFSYLEDVGMIELVVPEGECKIEAYAT